ncbi:family 43 glycosylhydrolase [Sphingomonas aracearum]|uniref:Glycosyl hydrolase 43 family protein n=1 Tax=Sphingomonas aracearum TaxID=2283317 RepID=A0A369VYV6_9SPHN|nr:family 43 glycosylhydrolase [Sphingomonas aracearum]RDE07333.1 glycosyl hydrolase 43 family protein [Sphingomonas aracearum]
MRRLLAMAAAAGLAVAAAAGPAQEVASVLTGADPDMEAGEDRYWIYPTGGGGLFAWSSVDMKHWERGPRLLSLAAIPWVGDDGAAVHHLWAPDMVAANGSHYLYYSIGPQHPTPSRIGVARCDTLQGPCTDSGKPLVNDGGHGFEAIDPAVFVDSKSGTPYLYAGGSAGATLRVWALRPDMVSIDHEVKVATPRHFTEGAFLFERNGTYYLSYSSGRYDNATYSVHYATAPSPTGPWRYAGRLLASDGKYKGPGHHAFLHDPRDGRWYIAYHRWEGQSGNGPYKGGRVVAIQPVSFGTDGSILPIRMTN